MTIGHIERADARRMSSDTEKQSLPLPGDQKIKRVYQMGDWEEEMDSRTGTRPHSFSIKFAHAFLLRSLELNVLGFLISQRKDCFLVCFVCPAGIYKNLPVTRLLM